MTPASSSVAIILFLFLCFSNTSIQNGINIGHTTWANIRKVYEAGCSQFACTGFNSASQSTPSENCCIAKSKGMHERIRWGVLRAQTMEATPIPVRTALAPKLAEGEKHI